jgi:hypothetical protein
MENGMKHFAGNDGWKKVRAAKTTIEEVMRVTQTEQHFKSNCRMNPNKTFLGERFLMARWQSVNLLHTGAGGRRLWQLSAKRRPFAVQDEKALLGKRSPACGRGHQGLAQALFRGKLNIAWLPPEKVFLRAIQLPSWRCQRSRANGRVADWKSFPLCLSLTWSGAFI